MSTSPSATAPSDHACHSGKHRWLDPELARYCCNPEYKVVQDTRPRPLTAMGAVCVRRVAEGTMYRGYMLKDLEEIIQTWVLRNVRDEMTMGYKIGTVWHMVANLREHEPLVGIPAERLNAVMQDMHWRGIIALDNPEAPEKIRTLRVAEPAPTR